MTKRRKVREKIVDVRLPPIGNAMAAESDRGCVLVGVAYIEEILGKAMWLHFEKMTAGGTDDDLVQGLLESLFSGRMPAFGNFGIKSATCFVVGLIDRNTFNCLEKLREVRNEFAHSPGGVAIDATAVAYLIEQLDDLSRRVIGYSEALGHWDRAAPGCSIIRKRFMAATTGIYTNLAHAVENISPGFLGEQTLLQGNMPPAAPQ